MSGRTLFSRHAGHRTAPRGFAMHDDTPDTGPADATNEHMPDPGQTQTRDHREPVVSAPVPPWYTTIGPAPYSRPGARGTHPFDAISPDAARLITSIPPVAAPDPAAQPAQRPPRPATSVRADSRPGRKGGLPVFRITTRRGGWLRLRGRCRPAPAIPAYVPAEWTAAVQADREAADAMIAENAARNAAYDRAEHQRRQHGPRPVYQPASVTETRPMPVINVSTSDAPAGAR